MAWKTRNIVLLALAFCLLTGSVGVAATQRFCAMLGMPVSPDSGEKGQKMNCCTKKQKPACPETTAKVDKAKCCSISVTHHKLDVQSALKFDKVEMVALPPMLVNTFLLPPTPTSIQTKAWPLYSDTSPPVAGRELLHRLHILNI
ncbi:HYC_CC_PP family protein [Sabulibacter ruber]|uniref:HYC_CC_PP family protein n=1 Tax=Sabulibacter ruber TaxID=2811901 RepID=UPI001A95A852|nr:hypothetical protein [Sabulibacter ruber]